MAGYNLEKFRAFADRRIRTTIYSTIFKRVPLLSFMVGLGGTKSKLDRPGTLGLISGAPVPRAKREEVDGGVYTDVEILTAKSGGGKTRTARDTNPAVEQSQDQNLGSARFWWWFYGQPVKVWRSTMRLSGKRKYQIQNALTRSIDMARDELVDTIHDKLWNGSPSTYSPDATEDMYDDLPGVLDCMDDSNSYGNVDRSDNSNYVDGRHPWSSNRETAARSASVDLIDEANDVCQVYGDGVDLVLTTRKLYRALKKEAIGKGGAIYHQGQVPGHGTVGYKKEFIMYGDTVITFDPKCPAGYFACFTLSDWCIEIHSEDKFQVDEWERVKIPGQDDAYVSTIDVGLRPYCTRPINQYLFTNVSAA